MRTILEKNTRLKNDFSVVPPETNGVILPETTVTAEQVAAQIIADFLRFREALLRGEITGDTDVITAEGNRV